jgi:ligand-binding sensor domain-containing protein/serine phosphatase RsbU (regulator of sigma subunit)
MCIYNKHISKWLASFVLVLLCHFFIIAQDLKFKHLSNDAGLSQVTAQLIYQDSQGFMWIGTQDGLNRYDGYHFKVFKNNPSDKKSISSNIINCIYEDEKGLMYIGTQSSGLSVYDRYTETFSNYIPNSKANSIASPAIRSISSIDKDHLIIGTEKGLVIFDKNQQTFELVKPSNISSDFYILSIFKTSSNKLLIVAPRYGIYEYKVNTKELIPFYIPEKPTNPDYDVYKTAFITIGEKNKNLYLGTASGGVHVINENSGKLIKKIDFEKDNYLLNHIRDIKQVSNSPYIFIATLGGLIKYNTTTANYSINIHDPLDNNSIISNTLLYLFIDKTQNIWVGSEDNGIGINFNSYQTFAHFKNGKTNDINIINCFLETKNKTIYIGSNNGLYEFNKVSKSFTNSTLVSESNPTTIQSLYEDNKGIIWIGTISQGLYTYDSHTQKTTKLLDHYFETAEINKIISDKNGIIWVGSYNKGLFSINPNTLETTQYTINEGLSSNKILSLYFDNDKNKLWVCTGDAGICVLDFSNNVKKPHIEFIKHSDTKNSLSSNIINNIRKDNNGTYWISTTNGLNNYNPITNQFKHFTETDGLANNYVYDALPDNKGNLWLPTNNGLSKFNPNNLNTNNTFKNYTISDGLQSKEFNQGASLQCADGSILVGGLNGFNFFNPNTLLENKIAPNAFIYSFSRQGKEIITDSSMLFKKYMELPYEENYFTFELIAQNYSSPEKTKFMFKLEGKDHEWSSPSDIRFTSYTGLSGGTYTFKVKASNADGVWDETPYQITIKVIPPWYKTLWFFIITGISFVALIFGFINYRTNSIKKINKVLENKVIDRTKELAQKNKDITSSIEYAKRIQEAILPPQELIFSNLKNSFILYKPKDIVSGDFYWFEEKGDIKILAVVDCTGHGVPGAFMSMIGHNLLNQIVSEKGNYDPGNILQELHKGVQAALKQDQHHSDNNDGMDVSIVTVNTKTKECWWAGAFITLVFIKATGELEKIEGDKYPIGGSQLDSNRGFTTHTLHLGSNDSIYLFSDGYADQFGGEKGKKFMVKKFHQNLLAIHHLAMQEQKQVLESQFNDWKASYEQVDDVLVIGIKM